jgi:heme exporter protein B
MRPSNTSRLWQELQMLLLKEWRIEMRRSYSLAGVLLYSAITVYTVGIGLRIRVADPVWIVLFWVILLFAAVNAVGRSFLAEREGHLLYLYGLVSPQAILLAKLVYNLILLWVISFFTFGLYVFIVQREGLSVALLLPGITVGAFALAGTLTLMSALTARAGAGPALMAVLSLPLLMPQMLLLIRYSQGALLGVFRFQEFYGLALFGLGVTALALVLYPFLWRE